MPDITREVDVPVIGELAQWATLLAKVPPGVRAGAHRVRVDNVDQARDENFAKTIVKITVPTPSPSRGIVSTSTSSPR